MNPNEAKKIDAQQIHELFRAIVEGYTYADLTRLPILTKIEVETILEKMILQLDDDTTSHRFKVCGDAYFLLLTTPVRLVPDHLRDLAVKITKNPEDYAHS